MKAQFIANHRCATLFVLYLLLLVLGAVLGCLWGHIDVSQIMGEAVSVACVWARNSLLALMLLLVAFAMYLLLLEVLE